MKDEALRSHPSAEQNETIVPAFPGGSEAIVFCLNDYYCPYFSVMLCSVVEHASPLRQYDIIVLHRDITEENQRLLGTVTAGRDNVSLRFLNVSARIEGYTLFIGGKSEFTVDTYLRLLIPYVLDDAYKKGAVSGRGYAGAGRRGRAAGHRPYGVPAGLLPGYVRHGFLL